MRDVEAGKVFDHVAEQNQIEIERAWRVGVRPFAPEGLFD
jgi:hypothetical protein